MHVGMPLNMTMDKAMRMNMTLPMTKGMAMGMTVGMTMDMNWGMTVDTEKHNDTSTEHRKETPSKTRKEIPTGSTQQTREALLPSHYKVECNQFIYRFRHYAEDVQTQWRVLKQMGLQEETQTFVDILLVAKPGKANTGTRMAVERLSVEQAEL